jgi:hypothetical protein
LGERYTDLLEEYRQLLRAAFQRWNGNVVDTQGDAFFVAFARASDAVSGAVAAQRALASHVWPEGVIVRRASRSWFLFSKQTLHPLIQDPCWARKREQIGDRGLETRRFR